MRPAFLAAAARPFLRRYSEALSTSASHSVSAFLQSDMPAPVRSRSSLIIAAVTSAILTLLIIWPGHVVESRQSRSRSAVATLDSLSLRVQLARVGSREGL